MEHLRSQRSARIGPDARGMADEVVRQHRERHRGNIQEGLADGVAGQRAVDNAGVHRIIGRDDPADFGIRTPVARPAGRIGRLTGDIVDENIRVRGDARRLPLGLECGRSHGGRRLNANRNTGVIHEAVHLRRFRPIESVPNDDVRRVAENPQIERLLIESPLVAVGCPGEKTGETPLVGPARSRRREVARCAPPQAVRNVRLLGRE